MAASSADGWGDEWDRVADVVVVGSGVAGYAAALAAADAGADVVLLEREAVRGGTTAKSGGAMWIPDNPFMREAGLVDDRDSALRYLARLAHPTRYRPQQPHLGLPEEKFRLLETFFDNASPAVQRLTELGALEMVMMRSPDYFAGLPEDTAPVGRLLYPVVPPDRPAEETGGQLLIDRMHAAAERLGVQVLLQRRVVHAVRTEDGAVVGVEVHARRGTELVGARRGVVFCSGGFLHNPELTDEYLRGPVLGGAAARGSTGDFVAIGTEVGARFGNMSHAWWAQVVVDLVARSRETIQDCYMPFGDSVVMVNRYGRRVVNEKSPYNERSQVHFAWDPVRGEYPNLLLFLVWDGAVAERPGAASILRYPVPVPGDHPDHVVTADTWTELAAALGTRLAALADITGGADLDPGFAEGLAATVRRFDAMAAAGVDEDFHRGESPLEQAWAGPPRGGVPSGAMHPFRDHGPYHAVVLGPGALDTKGGPMTDRHTRVIGLDGSPVPGLFGAGNCVASPAGQAYWGPGATVGPALTLGHVAGRTAASEPPRRP